MPLVKAVQELSQRNDEMNSEIGHLKSEIAELKSHVFPGNPSTLTGASLEQNIPNPFTQSTAINYTLPQQYKLAKIIVTDKSGKALKEVNISGIGKNTVTVDASALSAGSYQYSLYVDGKLISTKQMIQSR